MVKQALKNIPHEVDHTVLEFFFVCMLPGQVDYIIVSHHDILPDRCRTLLSLLTLYVFTENKILTYSSREK